MSRLLTLFDPAAGVLGGGASFLPFADSFDTDGAMAAPWLNSAWSVSSGAAAAVVTLGSELLTNPGFEGTYNDLSGGDGGTVNVAPNWNNSNCETDGTDTLNESTGIVHGGSKSQYVLVDSNAEGIYSVDTTGAIGWYQMSCWVYPVSGAARLQDNNAVMSSISGGASAWEYLISTGLTTSANRSLMVRCYGSGAEFNVDDASLKSISLASMLQLVDASAANVTATGKATITANTQSGVAACWDSNTSPANGVVGLYNRAVSRARLLKCVAGTWTTVIDAAAAYSAGAIIKVVQTGNTTFQLWYNGVQIGTDVTISDAGIISNTLHGIFSTYANSFDDFTLEAS